MEKDEQLGALMAGFRGANLSDADFAARGQAMRFVEADSDAGEGLPLVYDPAAISAYWWVAGPAAGGQSSRPPPRGCSWPAPAARRRGLRPAVHAAPFCAAPEPDPARRPALPPS
jgi:hypothetical protein